MTQDMAALAGRLRRLRNAEALIAFALPAALVVHWTRDEEPVAWLLRAAGLALVSALLLQGALYWHLKLASVTRRGDLPSWFARVFAAFRRANLVAFALVAAAFAAAWAWGARGADLGWSAGLLCFGVLEHVNYYHWQLMYDNERDLRALWRRGRPRRAALGEDLRRAARPPQTAG